MLIVKTIRTAGRVFDISQIGKQYTVQLWDGDECAFDTVNDAVKGIEEYVAKEYFQNMPYKAVDIESVSDTQLQDMVEYIRKDDSRFGFFLDITREGDDKDAMEEIIRLGDASKFATLGPEVKDLFVRKWKYVAALHDNS